MLPVTDVADFLIIGSGASGRSFAWHLSRLQCLRNVCLELGVAGVPGHSTHPNRSVELLLPPGSC